MTVEARLSYILISKGMLDTKMAKSNIFTYSKKIMSPFDPLADDIDITDIAHSLSMLCRANGHFETFYSVAQHSVNCAVEAEARGYSKRVQAMCLLHDAAEAYISDIPRPVKEKLPEIRPMEEKIQDIIYEKYLGDRSTKTETAKVKEIDDLMLVLEFNYFQVPKMEKTDTPLSSPDFSERPFSYFRNKYIDIFLTLTDSNEELPFVNVDQDDPISYIGIDGCKNKWLAVRLNRDGYNIFLFDDIDDIKQSFTPDDKILIDMPIGLIDIADDRYKRPDSQLRKSLPGKASSVFNTPFRSIAYEDDIAKAWDISNSQDGRMNSMSMAFRKHVKTVDFFLQNNPKLKNVLLESHPEYCFAVLNDGNPILTSKLTPEGIRDRINVLNRYYIKTEELLEQALEDISKRIADDVLDALCLAVCAKLGADYGFLTIPETPYTDPTGLKMQIVYPKLRQ